MVTGHSAGGHLALWAASRKKLKKEDELYLPHPLAVAGVVPLAGIPDLEGAIRFKICEGSPMQLMGGSAEAFPSRYREGSPKHQVPLGVPQIFISGSHDTIVPFQYVQDYVNFAKGKGEKNIFLWEFDDAAHFEVVFPETNAGSSLSRAIKELFRHLH